MNETSEFYISFVQSIKKLHLMTIPQFAVNADTEWNNCAKWEKKEFRCFCKPSLVQQNLSFSCHSDIE